jgi:hypothetical protein
MVSATGAEPIGDTVEPAGAYDSDEDYDSDLEQPAMTADRARRKLTSAITGADLDLATLPDFDHPSDENYNVEAAQPTIGCAKFYIVEICEAIKWYAEALAADGDAPADDTETLVRMYRAMDKHGRSVGPRCLLQLSLVVSAYLDCLCNGRMQDLEHERSPFDELPPAPRITELSNFHMRPVRETSSPELRASRTEDSAPASGRLLLEMLRALDKNINAALLAVGEDVPVTWRELRPHIVLVPHEPGDVAMLDSSSDSDGSD